MKNVWVLERVEENGRDALDAFSNIRVFASENAAVGEAFRIADGMEAKLIAVHTWWNDERASGVRIVRCRVGE